MADASISKSKYKRNDLTAEYVRSILDYDPETGIFKWKYRPEMLNNPKTIGWNTKYSGQTAGRKKGKRSEIGINGKLYLAHRIAWLWMTGDWPSEEIDHKNGNEHDNKWDNFRPATHAENMFNRKMEKRNKTGFKGVSVKNGKIVARINFKNKEIYLGIFDTIEKAAEAYKIAAEKYHGEFMRIK